jgi:hypothetical protein
MQRLRTIAKGVKIEERWRRRTPRGRLVSHLSGGELGDGLGALRDGVLGKLTWEDEAERRLNLAGGKGLALVVLDEAAGLSRDLVEGVVDEGVHDGHGLLGDGDLWVHLLQHTVNVGVVGLLALAAAGASLLGGAFACLRLLSHGCKVCFWVTGNVMLSWWRRLDSAR